MVSTVHASGLRSDKNSSRTRAHAPRHSSIPTAHIVIIDDDDEIREALDELLRSIGYEVASFERAEDALEQMEMGATPDLIVLDLMLPGMNGWHFRIEQKNRPHLREVPVIALSADVSPYAKAVDADAYVPKPFDFDELEAVIGRVLLAAERRRLLVKSMELERIRALGTLVASVAHEINNPLTYVLGCLELATRQTRELESLGGPGARVVESLSQNLAYAVDGATRIGSVVKLLSTFSRADRTDAQTVDVLRAVQAASRLARHQIARTTRFREMLEPVPSVLGNEARLAQVVLNLLVNAAQAVASTSRENEQVGVATRVDQASVVIEVSDTGPGIEPRLLDQIFEPFFTTKPAGTGTGLGLSISRDIIAGMGGSLTVRSVLGHGATFVVTLPVADAESPAPGRGGAQAQRSGGSERRILVIDDEPMIGRMVQSALSRDVVEVCLSPQEALRFVATRAYDVILCDYEMPEMSGLEFYRALVELSPDAQSTFLLMTGFHEHAEITAFAQAQSMRVLHKPFTVGALEQSLSSQSPSHATV